MDKKAQWQLIFVALWGSGAFDTQEDAKRKTDEIIANRPSLGKSYVKTYQSEPIKSVEGIDETTPGKVEKSTASELSSTEDDSISAEV